MYPANAQLFYIDRTEYMDVSAMTLSVGLALKARGGNFFFSYCKP